MVQYTNPKKAGRRPRELADDMEEEDDRKLKRRLRNKQAAARCRQRRLDLMSTLQQQVDELKKRNDKKTKEVMDIKNSLSAMKEYIQSHDCKMSHEAREHALKLFLPSLDTSAIFQQQQLQQQQHMHQQQQQHHRQHHQMQQNEPTTSKIREISQPQPQMNQVLTKDAYDEEIEYKPNVEFRLQGAQKRKWRPEHSEFNLNMLPPISTMTDKKMDNIGTDEGFLEPESRINKLSDPTLAQMNQGGEVERPSNLPMLTPGSSSVAITTPSRLTNSAYDAFPFAVNLGGDFLSQSTGLTPSGQPTMNFVNNTPTPLHNADLRPL